MKKLLPFLCLPLLICSSCAVAKGLVRDVCKAVEAAIDIPVGLTTNTVATVKDTGAALAK